MRLIMIASVIAVLLGFFWCLCRASARGDRDIEELLRREARDEEAGRL